MLCPPAPAAYTEFERRHYAGKWWFRVSPTSPWQLCRAKREDDKTELALAAIYAVLFPNALQGWEEWNRYAAAGEWL